MSDSEATEEPLGSKYTAEQLVELWSAYLIEGARYGDLDDVREALSNSADVNAIDDSHRTALHCAAANGHSTIMQTLLDAGANTELRNDTGSTALHWACVGGCPAAVRLLLDNSADASALNDADQTPLDGALDNAEILGIFQRHSQAGLSSAADAPGPEERSKGDGGRLAEHVVSQGCGSVHDTATRPGVEGVGDSGSPDGAAAAGEVDVHSPIDELGADTRAEAALCDRICDTHL